MLCPNCGAEIPDHSRYCDECAYPVRKRKPLPSNRQEAGPISGLRLGYVAMRMHFRFSLVEKNGVVLFSYDYLKAGTGYVRQTDTPVDFVFLHELQQFVHANDYINLKGRDPFRRGLVVHDEPSCTLTLDWGDYLPLVIHSRSLPPNGAELKQFFINIAESTQ